MAKAPVKNVPAVTKPEDKNLMVVQSDSVPDYIKTDGEQRGSENVGQDDIIIPRLEIIQALSPQVKEGDPGYMEDARPGMLINSVTKQLYGKEVMVVPVVYTKQWLVWRKRKDKDGKAITGGFFGAFNSPNEAEDRMEREGGENNSIEVIDTPQHLCLLVNFQSGSVDEVMISMPRTKAKISRQWNSMIRLAGGDRFARCYRVTSGLEKNSAGQDYYNFVVAQSGFPAKVLYDRAEKLYEQIQAGARTVAMDVADYEEEGKAGHSSEM
jgi:hypothetical protein